MADEPDHDGGEEEFEREPDEAPELARAYREGFASIGKAISLAADWDAKRTAFLNGLREALIYWHGIERQDIIDGCSHIAEAKGLSEHFGVDEIQIAISSQVEVAEQTIKANGKGSYYYGPDDEPPPPQDAEQGKPVKEPPPPLQPIEFFSAEIFEGRALTERQWLVKDRIPMRNVTLLGGDGATGKTTIALQLFVGVTTTGEWLKGDVCQNGRVLFLTAEEEETEIHRRLDAIRDARELTYKDIARLHIHCMPGQNSVLAQPDKQGQLVPTDLFRRLELTIRAQRPTLICLESSADLFAGNEIDRVQVRHFISMLRSWSLIDGASVVLLSHPSAEGRRSGTGESGSTGWNNSVRSRLYFKFKKEKDVEDELTRNDYRILEVKKSNYGPSGESVECVWRNGIFIPVEQAVDDPIVKANKALNADNVFLHCLDIRNSREQWVNQEETSRSRYAPRLFASMAEAQGFKVKQLAESMHRLMDKNAIGLVKAPNRPPSDQLKILVRKQPALV